MPILVVSKKKKNVRRMLVLYIDFRAGLVLFINYSAIIRILHHGQIMIVSMELVAAKSTQS